MNTTKTKNIKNAFYLYILQFVNTILPFVTIPYITRVIGVEQYGVFNKVLNYIIYLQAFVEFGFTLNGAKKVSLAKDIKEITKIRSNITVCKLINFSFSFLIIIIISIFQKEAKQNICMILLSIIVIAEIFSQNWLFQGLEDMKPIAIINVVVKIFFTILIFLFIKNENSLILYSFLYSITFLISSLLGVLIINKKYKMTFVSVKKDEIIDEFKDGFALFVTSFSSKVFTGIAITMLGILSTDIEVGGYSAIIKIPQLLISIYYPISQVLYPYICKQYNTNINGSIRLIKKILLYILLILIIVCLVTVFIKNQIVYILFGSEYLSYATLLIPLIIWLLLSIVNNILGIQVIVARGYKRQYSIAFIISNILLILLCFLLTKQYGSIGAAFATLIGEAVLTLICILLIHKKGLLKERKVL